MRWVALAVIGACGIALAYKSISPLRRRRKRFDVDAVSEHWLAHQRVQSSDQHWNLG